MLRRFFEDAQETIAKIYQGIEDDDLQQVRSAAHGLKGICENFGVVGLARMCREIEQQARLGAHNHMSVDVAELKKELATAHTLILEQMLVLRPHDNP